MFYTHMLDNLYKEIYANILSKLNFISKSKRLLVSNKILSKVPVLLSKQKGALISVQLSSIVLICWAVQGKFGN